MQRDYDTKYIVKNVRYDYYCRHITIVPVYELFELTSIKNFYPELKRFFPDYTGVSKKQTLIIELHNWKNIAVLPDVSENNLTELVEHGALILEKSHVYDTEIDAKIQLVLVFLKNSIGQEHVYGVTKGQFDYYSYGDLVNKLYEDFPEKFV